MTNAPADSRSGPNMVQIPFIFVKLGDPLPMRGMAEHSGYIRVPAVMVPRGSPPPRERGARACPPTAVQGIQHLMAAQQAVADGLQSLTIRRRSRPSRRSLQ